MPSHKPTHLTHQMPDYPGLLITLEGIDGSGKTVLLKALTQELKSQGYRVITTKEPGGTKIGRMLKQVLLEEEKACDARVEYLLFAADRAEHFARLIIPELEKGSIVISDRMADSALAYQGYGRGLDKEFIRQTNAWAMRNIVPDLTFYLKIPVELSFARRAGRGHSTDTMEREGIEFWKKAAAGYDAIAQSRNSITTIDATHTKEEVFARARQTLQRVIAHKPELACENTAHILPY